MRKPITAKLGKHLTVSKDLKSVFSVLRNHPGVTKTPLGPFQPCTHRYPVGSLKILSENPAGFRVNGYCGDGVQIFYVYVVKSLKQEVQMLLLKYSSSNGQAK